VASIQETPRFVSSIADPLLAEYKLSENDWVRSELELTGAFATCTKRHGGCSDMAPLRGGFR
jgi:hypothetical protein